MRAFVLVFFSFWLSAAFAGEMEFFVYRAPSPLDWSSPGALGRTSYWNSYARLPDGSYYPHYISHVNVKLRCGDGPAVYRGMAGTKSTFRYVADLFVRGMSLDAMLISTAGRFYRDDEILAGLATLKPLGYVRSFKILLREDQCGAARGFLRDYEAAGMDRIYGGVRADPLLGQGAGCSMFAVSFLRVLNLMEPGFSDWRRRLRIPERLLASKTRWAEMGLTSFLRGWDSAWAGPSEAAVDVEFWDPEKIYEWIGRAFEGRAGPEMAVRVSEFGGKFLSVTWDARAAAVSPRPSPFLLSLPQIARNARSNSVLADQFLTDDELRNPVARECRDFGFCRPPEL